MGSNGIGGAAEERRAGGPYEGAGRGGGSGSGAHETGAGFGGIVDFFLGRWDGVGAHRMHPPDSCGSKRSPCTGQMRVPSSRKSSMTPRESSQGSRAAANKADGL
jgi:hypothetical protein